MRIYILAILMLSAGNFLSAQSMPVLRADSNRVSYRVDNKFRDRGWTLTPELRPDQLDVLVHDKPVKVDFIAGDDSISFQVVGGRQYDFAIVRPGRTDTAFTRVLGIRYVAPAKFSAAHIRDLKGKTTVEIPPIYELVNILYAIAPVSKEKNDFVYKRSAYYKEVMDWFSPYANDTLVLKIDKALKDDQYYLLKMDAYSFDWKNGKILQSAVYDHTSWRDTNTLRSFIPAMQAFARRSKFGDFLKKQQGFYDAQVRCYRDSVNTPAMMQWLRKNFPGTDYDAFRIIFSPLVGGNQSANWMEDNGFSEMHAHVNFPYSAGIENGWTAAGELFRRGNIVFTEINHSFINPEADKYVSDPAFRKAFANLETWLDMKKPASNYANPLACFAEYMNWGLVSLYAVDAAPPADRDKVIDATGKMMTEYRGFRHFDTFNKFLVDLYRNRAAGATVASLYPAIINWFATYKP